jgi:hypothetical protein
MLILFYLYKKATGMTTRTAEMFCLFEVITARLA